MSGPTKFVADAMLGSLARKLRIFGFDTTYFKDGPDSELERIAEKESRIIVTSDRSLASHANLKGIVALPVSGRSDAARIRSLLGEARSASLVLSPGGPRCAVCNSALETMSKEAAKRLLPATVVGRHRLYFWCASCKKAYWRGRHWSRLSRLSALISHR